MGPAIGLPHWADSCPTLEPIDRTIGFLPYKDMHMPIFCAILCGPWGKQNFLTILGDGLVLNQSYEALTYMHRRVQANLVLAMKTYETEIYANSK